VADKTAEPVRRVILKFWEHAVERTEAEIEELKAHGYFVRDATPDDKLAPHDEAETQRAAAAALAPPAVVTPPAAAAPAKPKE
jgi:hypothetical protein